MHWLPIQGLHSEYTFQPPMRSNVKESKNLELLTLYWSEGTSCLYMADTSRKVRSSLLACLTVVLIYEERGLMTKIASVRSCPQNYCFTDCF